MNLPIALCVLAAAPQDLSSPAAPPQEREPGQERHQVPEIVVTGTLEERGVPVVPLNATGSRDVLGPEEVRRTGARDLNDLVQYLPAVSTRPYNGGDASAPSFSMRGLPDDGLTEYILVLIDGVPANPLPYGWTAFSFFPLITEQVYAIDLVRGGYSVRYSPNTVGGVLNLITPPIPAEESYSLRTTVGSHGYLSTLLSAGSDDGSLGYLVTLGERSGDGYRVDGDFEYRTADARLLWRFDRDDWLALRASYVENEHQAPGGLTLAEFEADRFGNSRPLNRFQGFRAVADVVRRVGDDDGHVEWFGWISQTRRNLFRQEPLFGEPTGTREIDDDAFHAAVGLRSGQRLEWLGLDHDLYFGLRVAQELLPNRTTTTRPPGGGAGTRVGDVEYSLTALSAHVDDTLRLSDDLTVVAGLRAEYVPIAKGEDQLTGSEFDDEFFALLPGVSMSYQLGDSAAAFANYQRSFRSPQVFGFDTSVADPMQEIGFESGESFELGLRSDGPGGLSGSVAGWRTDFDDVGIFDLDGLYQTIGGIRAEGVDFVLRWEAGRIFEPLEGFSLYVSYTLQDSELLRAVDPENDGNRTPYAWRNKAAWSLQYRTADRWRFALGGVHVGDSYSDEANTLEENPNGNLGLNRSRTIWNAQIAKDFSLGRKALGTFAIGATNLFDEEWDVHSRGGFFGGGKVAGPPQQLYVGLTLSL